ncbi:hypothetical protein BKA65DRAFT_492981 [Rhexocercosporidium sp. MPI-PUGE-AT-0058]|nr:hypothetical protein BKA65DRAFT_492981 [Rhexocercosporidium sp. MPI-PUGE-AT-0058]
MGLNLSVGRISSGHDGLDNGVAAVVSFEKSANSISSKNGLSGRRSSYAVSSPSSFLVPNAANMASVTYSQRQREEFELPPSPFRSRLPTSTVQKLSRPMNIEQILYAKTAVVAPPQPGCDNCKHPGHMLKDCKEPCGLCDRARHTARECTFRLRRSNYGFCAVFQLEGCLMFEWVISRVCQCVC